MLVACAAAGVGAAAASTVAHVSAWAQPRLECTACWKQTVHAAHGRKSHAEQVTLQDALLAALAAASAAHGAAVQPASALRFERQLVLQSGSTELKLLNCFVLRAKM